jgi:hypothetical protein
LLLVFVLVILPVSVCFWWICFWFCFLFFDCLLKPIFSVQAGVIMLESPLSNTSLTSSPRNCWNRLRIYIYTYIYICIYLFIASVVITNFKSV